MRILICGGRDYRDYFRFAMLLENALQKQLNINGSNFHELVIISGGARGADRLAEQWAASYNIVNLIYYAEWDTYGKSAGYKRNVQMLEEGKPDVVIAFPGGKGTAMMKDIARKAGVPVIELE